MRHFVFSEVFEREGSGGSLLAVDLFHQSSPPHGSFSAPLSGRCRGCGLSLLDFLSLCCVYVMYSPAECAWSRLHLIVLLPSETYLAGCCLASVRGSSLSSLPTGRPAFSSLHPYVGFLPPSRLQSFSAFSWCHLCPTTCWGTERYLRSWEA